MIPFRKMNGLGNDFVVVDNRSGGRHLPQARIRALADRTHGIGFDQFIVIEPADPSDEAVARMRIHNADGGEVEACGNAARCVAALLIEEEGTDVAIASAGGAMRAWRAGPGAVAIDMGVPRFAAADIPLAALAADASRLTLPEPELAALGPAACVNVGNPHAVFFVPDADAVPLETLGPMVERHRMFPQRVNASFATVLAPDRVRARVYERGVGATKACGTAACAIAAVGERLGLTGREVDVDLPGGTLSIAVRGGRIVMTGSYAHDWSGAITADGYVRDADAAA